MLAHVEQRDVSGEVWSSSAAAPRVAHAQLCAQVAFTSAACWEVSPAAPPTPSWPEVAAGIPIRVAAAAAAALVRCGFGHPQRGAAAPLCRSPQLTSHRVGRRSSWIMLPAHHVGTRRFSTKRIHIHAGGSTATLFERVLFCRSFPQRCLQRPPSRLSQRSETGSQLRCFQALRSCLSSYLDARVLEIACGGDGFHRSWHAFSALLLASSELLFRE